MLTSLLRYSFFHFHPNFFEVLRLFTVFAFLTLTYFQLTDVTFSHLFMKTILTKVISDLCYEIQLLNFLSFLTSAAFEIIDHFLLLRLCSLDHLMQYFNFFSKFFSYFPHFFICFLFPYICPFDFVAKVLGSFSNSKLLVPNHFENLLKANVMPGGKKK